MVTCRTIVAYLIAEAAFPVEVVTAFVAFPEAASFAVRVTTVVAYLAVEDSQINPLN